MSNDSTKLITDLSLFDAVTIQSAGLRKSESGEYAPTLYSDSDEFGMLGGNMRVLAAVEIYKHYPALPFVFCNGRSAKQIAKFGPDVPTDAEIYAKEFDAIIDSNYHDRINEKLHKPVILLENSSVNTVASISELMSMSTKHRWKSIVLISSDYHIPRIRALCDLIFEQLHNHPVKITFLSAEAILKELQPGIYDVEIDNAYKTELARVRIKNEENGLRDIEAGRYHIGEFQLAPND